MPSWSDEDYFSTGLYFPLAPLHLHVMLVGCGFEKRTEHAYDWNGLRRGESPMCIFQCTVDGEGELMIGGGCRRLPPDCRARPARVLAEHENPGL